MLQAAQEGRNSNDEIANALNVELLGCAIVNLTTLPLFHILLVTECSVTGVAVGKVYSNTVTVFVAVFLFFIPFEVQAADFTVHGTPMTLEWNDGWFAASPTVYNHGMARVAALLSCVAYEQDTNKAALPQCYRALGVKDGDIYLGYDLDYNDAVWGNDQCAFSLAVKDMSGGKKAIFLVVRGTPANMNEWLSNLNLNDNGKTEREMHEGFAKASRQVELALAAFVVEHKIDYNDACLFITGHSRGAAVANIVAADISRAKFFPTERVFAYTFAAPNVTTAQDASSATYNYIWNIVSGEDVVPAVPFDRGNWQYRKWGRTRVFVNYWNTDASLFIDDRMPRMNEVFKMLVGRDYCPWYLGSFLPVQVVSAFAERNKDVSVFYRKSRGLLTRLIDKVLLSPAIMGTAEEADAEGKRNMLMRVLDIINRRTDGFVDYAFKALNDMHASESYLSWITALDEDEAFSTLGYSQIVITGREEGAVMNGNGEVLARIIEGRVKLASLKMPVGAFTLDASRVAVGVPGNVDLFFVMTNESLIATPARVTVEHYGADSSFISASEAERICPRRGVVYEWPIGKTLTEGNALYVTKLRGKQAKAITKKASIKVNQMFGISPEFTFNTDRDLGVSIRAGCQAVYGVVAADFPLARRHDRFDLAGGVGTQCTLVGPLVLELAALGKMSWVYATDGKLFNFVPELRAAFVTHPWRRLSIVTGASFDFHIDGVNDAAFCDEARSALLGEISMGDSLSLAPRIMLGVRF